MSMLTPECLRQLPPELRASKLEDWVKHLKQSELGVWEGGVSFYFSHLKAGFVAFAMQLEEQ